MPRCPGPAKVVAKRFLPASHKEQEVVDIESPLWPSCPLWFKLINHKGLEEDAKNTKQNNIATVSSLSLCLVRSVALWLTPSPRRFTSCCFKNYCLPWTSRSNCNEKAIEAQETGRR